MDVTLKMAAVASAMSSPSRLKMLEALAGGVARSAIDLAVIADIQQNTATTHLQSLGKNGLVKVIKQGRYRFFQIADDSVGDLIEALGKQTGHSIKSNIPPPMTEMAFGRTCYDHLAGWLGVQLSDSMKAKKYVENTGKLFNLTTVGQRFLETELGIDIAEIRSKRRMFARACQDWTEGEAHIGGALGAELFCYFERKKWVKKDAEYREVYLLPKGKVNFKKHFGIQT
ncbi:MAG: DNA-binding transcriptional ArsR family regulator [Parasphingorhabdus sp.]|jgi:DNA-binding transcriptional ArsR family regulator